MARRVSPRTYLIKLDEKEDDVVLTLSVGAVSVLETIPPKASQSYALSTAFANAITQTHPSNYRSSAPPH
jgi:hypothetical protein